ncbi:MAG: metallophosphoesterase family protein, partial [Lachnospiraceae bacterium]
MKQKTKRIVPVLLCAAAAAVLLAARLGRRDTEPTQAAASTTSRTFLVASDLHYLSPALNDNGTFFLNMMEQADGKTTQYAEEVTEAFVEDVIAQHPAALVLTGDLTFNGAKKSHQDLAKKLQKIRDAGIPVYVLSGNHDLNSTNAARFHGDSYDLVDGVTPEEFTKIYADFGFDDALSVDSASFSYVVRPWPGMRFLLLDVNGVEEPCRIPDSTLSWIQDQLQDAKDAGDLVLSFSHQNLLQHSLFTDGYV